MLWLGCLDDAACFFLAVWTTRRALSWLFGRRGVHFSTVAAAEARTSYSSFGGEHGGRGADGNFFDGEPAAEARRHAFFFWRGPRRRRQGRHIFLLAGSTAAEAGTASLFLTRSSAEEARTAYNLFWQGERILFFGSGTAEVIRQRRRDLRAGRLPLRLFGSDRNDDSQFSSRLALRR